MYQKVIKLLDKVANSLQGKGLTNEAEKLDVVANTLELKIANDIVSQEPIKTLMSMNDDIKKLYLNLKTIEDFLPPGSKTKLLIQDFDIEALYKVLETIEEKVVSEWSGLKLAFVKGPEHDILVAVSNAKTLPKKIRDFYAQMKKSKDFFDKKIIPTYNGVHKVHDIYDYLVSAISLAEDINIVSLEKALKLISAEVNQLHKVTR